MIKKSNSIRLNIIKKAGIDTSKFFSLNGIDGVPFLAYWKEDKCAEFTDEEFDEIAASIKDGGYIKNNSLFRRFITAQFFGRLRDKNGFVKSVRNSGYGYMVNMVHDEIRVLKVLQAKDEECFQERSIFFSPRRISNFMMSIVWEIRRQSSAVRLRPMRGREVVMFGKQRIGTDEFLSRTSKMESIAVPVCQLSDYGEILAKYEEFIALIPKLDVRADTAIDEFLNPFVKSGYYFSLKNLALFHNVSVGGETGDDAVGIAMERAKNGGYASLIGDFNVIMRDNNFDFYAKMREIYS